ncbi:5363_t:CDS:1, partial [Paraglomus occultum]
PDDLLHDPRNTINSRVKVLKEFFLSLRRSEILPTFVLVDKDAGQIAAIQEAWSWTANIQLCLWHVKRAIDRKLQDKKYKSSQYTARKAKKANEQFHFIDASWIPGGILCPQEKRKEVLNMVKGLHPLIPISREIFLTSMKIYYQSVEEMYRFCRGNNLVHLWD